MPDPAATAPGDAPSLMPLQRLRRLQGLFIQRLMRALLAELLVGFEGARLAEHQAKQALRTGLKGLHAASQQSKGSKAKPQSAARGRQEPGTAVAAAPATVPPGLGDGVAPATGAAAAAAAAAAHAAAATAPAAPAALGIVAAPAEAARQPPRPRAEGEPDRKCANASVCGKNRAKHGACPMCTTCCRDAQRTQPSTKCTQHKLSGR